MLIKVITVGRIKDKNIQAKIDEFIKRIKFDAKIDMLEIKDSTKEKEGQKLLDVLNKEKGYVFAMSEEGKQMTSRQFSEKMAATHQKLIFIIGGPFGLIEEVKKKCNGTFSISKMTFTHEMAKMFLLEQIFRGISIIKGRGYHND